ncbi:MAG: DUF692 family protein [Chloroflexia bacterium]|nr:DUF692 family protein [Chloroflexia bacterium]
MTKLGANYFPALPALAQDPEIDFDYVKTGDWPEHDPHQALVHLPDKRVLFHRSNVIRNGRAETHRLANVLQEWQKHLDSPWVSIHLDYYSQQEVWAFLQQGQPLPHYTEQAALERLGQVIQPIQQKLEVPLLLENMPLWPGQKEPGATSPQFIRQILDATGCNLLLDTAHARVAAANLGWNIHAYLEQLPLDRVVEIHTSGPRRNNGCLIDSHETLQQEDYDLLAWLLQRTEPQVITLEYWKDPGRAREQMIQLANLVLESAAIAR